MHPCTTTRPCAWQPSRRCRAGRGAVPGQDEGEVSVSRKDSLRLHVYKRMVKGRASFGSGCSELPGRHPSLPAGLCPPSALLPGLPLPGPLLVLVQPLPPPCCSPATTCPSWSKLTALLSASILLFPQRTSSPPPTTPRRYLSVPGCPHTSSTLPHGQALKLSSTQSCFPGDSYVQVP